MAQEWAKPFYNSASWIQCRESYIISVHGLCEHCTQHGRLEAGYILHHKVVLTTSNIHDPDVTLNHDNLEYLCKDCHEAAHGKNIDRTVTRDGLVFDQCGNLVEA